MSTLLDEHRVFVTYATAAVFSGDDPDDEAPDEDAFWARQVNGLCGAAIPGVLKLTVATHTGWIPFRIELHHGVPAAEEAWEEIVEVSFVPSQENLYLQGLDAEARYPFTLPVNSYRTRYCARGFSDVAAGKDGVDGYLIQFWPADPSPDSIIKETSAEAVYWHRYRQGFNEIGPAEEDLRQSATESLAERERWGDRIPSERLRRAKGTFVGILSQLDIDLEFSLAERPDDVLRRIADWATLQCLERAGMAELSTFRPAVDALRHGQAMPKPFDDPARIASLEQEAAIRHTSLPAPPNGDYEQSPQEWATTAVARSTNPDPLAAALETVGCLAFVSGQHGYREALAELREAFPLDHRRDR